MSTQKSKMLIKNRPNFGKLDFCGKWDFVPGIIVDDQSDGSREPSIEHCQRCGAFLRLP